MDLHLVLQSRVRALVEDFSLAQRYHAPYICLGIYCSTITRNKVVNMLQKSLADAGIPFHTLQIDEQEYDFPLLIQQRWPDGRGVFSVQGLRQSRGTKQTRPYRALNVHREMLIQNNVSCILWVTEKVYRLLPRLAPDFWAFRHRVVEFLELPSWEERNPLNALAIAEFSPPEVSQSLIEELQMRLKREKSSFRAHETLCQIYYALGCYEKALLHCRRLIRLFPQNEQYRQSLMQIQNAIAQG